MLSLKEISLSGKFGVSIMGGDWCGIGCDGGDGDVCGLGCDSDKEEVVSPSIPSSGAGC